VPDDPPVVAVAYRGNGTPSDGILDYSRMLTDALEDGGVRAKLVTGDAVRDLPASARYGEALLLQYNPFSYGRWGFAPWLPRELHRLRRAGHAVAVMVHEAFIAPTRSREWILRGWQRAQCRAILRQADAVFASTEHLRDILRVLTDRDDIRHLPVGSNLPDRREARHAMRLRLGLGDSDLALVAFGTGHPSQLGSLIVRVAETAGGRAAALLNLGAGAPSLAGLPPDLRVLSPGRLPEDELAAWLAAGDLFVAPFSDGVSTRRTTLMAALQHELPVVGTLGSNTDRVLANGTSAVRLIEADNSAALERVVSELVDDHGLRREVALAGRRLYDERFAWPVIAAQVIDALRAPGRRAARR
jgi:glycosyltransferase involved in cell wall biosynthesis